MRTHMESLLARMRFRHLQLIAEIDRTGSLNKASAALSLTQPALSKALKEVEDMLGFALFVRSAHGLEKTAQGAVVVEGARLLMEELRHMRDEAVAAGPEGRLAAVLRLGAPAYLAVSMLPQIVSRLTTRTPPLAVSLMEANVPRLFEALAAGELDALVTVYNPDVLASAVDKELCFERLSEENYAVIAPAGHPFARSRKVSWEALADAPWVLTRKPSMARIFIEDCFLRRGLRPPPPVCETDSPVTNARLVAAGSGLSIVPGSTMLEAEREGMVRRVRVLPPPPAAVLGVVYRAASASHPRIALLREAIRGRRGGSPARRQGSAPQAEGAGVVM
ncbi:LysR family transcriptional regulator [Pigmentiphaga soli]|uniref:LysR family transcriptional regulator n=1 Tax=Pigmentiphaga soli TaxID=1007095 RepID=A0ABP8GDD0_9BURK